MTIKSNCLAHYLEQKKLVEKFKEPREVEEEVQSAQVAPHVDLVVLVRCAQSTLRLTYTFVRR